VSYVSAAIDNAMMVATAVALAAAVHWPPGPPHPTNMVPCAPTNMRSLAEQLVADARADGMALTKKKKSDYFGIVHV